MNSKTKARIQETWNKRITITASAKSWREYLRIIYVAVVVSRIRPAGCRPSEFAMTKAAAKRAMDALLDQTPDNDEDWDLELTYDEWSHLFGELTRLYVSLSADYKGRDDVFELYQLIEERCLQDPDVQWLAARNKLIAAAKLKVEEAQQFADQVEAELKQLEER